MVDLVTLTAFFIYSEMKLSNQFESRRLWYIVLIFRMVSAGSSNVDKYLEAQADEVEVLCSIYGSEWKTENENDRSYSITVKEGDHEVTLYVTLPKKYPFDARPTFTISSPGMKRECKQHLINLLEEVYQHNVGQPVLFQWIDKIKEYLTTLVSDVSESSNTGFDQQLNEGVFEPDNQIPEIIHGETISDRKSTFQGHVSFVQSVNEVRVALSELKKNRKVANATHNMFAYRINEAGDCLIQDCDDDGETNAGSRLLHLLKILNAINVLVVVTRWYGGIHLGSVRFSHINNAARQALEQAGVVSSKKKS